MAKKGKFHQLLEVSALKALKQLLNGPCAEIVEVKYKRNQQHGPHYTWKIQFVCLWHKLSYIYIRNAATSIKWCEPTSHSGHSHGI